ALSGSACPTRLRLREDGLFGRRRGVSAVRDGFSDRVIFRDADGDEISRVSGLGEDGRLDDAGEHYLSLDGGPVVVDVATGDKTPLDIGRANRGLQMGWDLDGNVVIATEPKDADEAPVDLMRCDPADGACTVLAEDVGRFSQIVLAGEGVRRAVSQSTSPHSWRVSHRSG